MKKKDEDNIKVIVPDKHQNDDEKEKKKNILLIVFGSVGAALITFFSVIAIILIVLTIIFVIGLSNLNKNKTPYSSDNAYVMDEYTENRYKTFITMLIPNGEILVMMRISITYPRFQ